jgi:hypothetical protein
MHSNHQDLSVAIGIAVLWLTVFLLWRKFGVTIKKEFDSFFADDA